MLVCFNLQEGSYLSCNYINYEREMILDYFEQLMDEIDSFDFSDGEFFYITETGRMQEVLVKWNYFSKIRPYLYNAKRLLDVGTGGGENYPGLHLYPKKHMQQKDTSQMWK